MQLMIRWFSALGVAACLFAAGCTPPSLLITPVSGRRGLTETEISRDSIFALDKIALIDVSGTIQNGSTMRLFGEGENPVSVLLEQLDKARRDPLVKAVILRINSPGGTVVTSELMHDEITHFKKSGKPVVAVMMDVAASGGYYIACACDEIVAQPSTVTGSIGVIMLMFDVSGTMTMIVPITERKLTRHMIVTAANTQPRITNSLAFTSSFCAAMTPTLPVARR